MKTLLALGAAAVALTATPSVAQRHYSNVNQCTKHVRGRCVQWHRMTRKQARRAGYAVGHRFGPRYSYTSYNALPRTYVTRYHLSPRYRYVYTNGYIYQVDPTTYAISRIIDAITR